MTGVGKTVLVRQVVEGLGKYTYCSCVQLFNAETGGTERRLLELFERATGVVVLDDVDAIACKPAGASGGQGTHPPIGLLMIADVEHRVLSVLKYALDTFEGSVIGVTSRPEAIDPEITRSGRLSDETHVSISTLHQRRAVLDSILPYGVLSEEDRLQIAKRTDGYNFADLERLYAVAFEQALRSDPVNVLVTYDDFGAALKQCRASIISDLPTLGIHSDVGPLVGVDALRDEVLRLICYPLDHSEKLRMLRLSPPRGVLLHGPSGSGKTALALDCALRSGLGVIHVQATQVRSKYVGESEKNLAKLFRRARECAPCILLIDQLDGLFTTRGEASQNAQDRLIVCLLTEMDGLLTRREGDGVFILATTSHPELIDKAVLRPGRIGTHLAMPSVDADLRRAFLQMKLGTVPLTLTDDQVARLSVLTDGISAAELDNLFREAALTTLRNDIAAREISPETIFDQIGR